MKGNWVWIIVALAVVAVNIWLGARQQNDEQDGLMWIIHYGLAAAALLFAVGLVIFSRMQQQSRQKLKALGLSDAEIDRLARSKAAEPEILARLQARATARPDAE